MLRTFCLLNCRLFYWAKFSHRNVNQTASSLASKSPAEQRGSRCGEAQVREARSCLALRCCRRLVSQLLRTGRESVCFVRWMHLPEYSRTAAHGHHQLSWLGRASRAPEIQNTLAHK